ncbi:hypothetical protein D3C85_1775850 [compost metagenome]
MKANRLTVAFRMGTPFTLCEHFALVIFLDQDVTVGACALVMHHAVIFRVMQALPLQGLHVSTARAWHVVVTLVAALEQIVDP